jgi:hypothetical protein
VALFEKRRAIRRLVESPADTVAELDGIIDGCRVGVKVIGISLTDSTAGQVMNVLKSSDVPPAF